MGAPGSGTELNARAIVRAAGLSYADFSKVEYLPFGESVDLMKNRQLDVTLQSAGLGVASLRDLASSVPIVVVPIPPDVVKAVGNRVVRWVREGNGPYILEMLTYRYRGHSMSDPGKYRSREEIQKMRDEHDPIEQVRRRLLETRLASEDELKAIDAEIRAIVVASAEFAQSDPEPDESELHTDVLLPA